MLMSFLCQAVLISSTPTFPRWKPFWVIYFKLVFVIFKVFYRQTLESSGMLDRYSVCFATRLRECSMIALLTKKTNAISTPFCQRWHRNTSHRCDIHKYLLTRNTQRLGSVAETEVIRLRNCAAKEVRDQIASCTFHSLL